MCYSDVQDIPSTERERQSNGMTTAPELELDNFFATMQNPYPAYTYLREHEPVRWNSMFSCYMLTRFDDVNMVFSDAKRFASDIWSNVPQRMGS